MSKRWRVESTVTLHRVRFVTAENQKEAEALSCDAEISHEDEVTEETTAIVEVGDRP